MTRLRSFQKELAACCQSYGANIVMLASAALVVQLSCSAASSWNTQEMLAGDTGQGAQTLVWYMVNWCSDESRALHTCYAGAKGSCQTTQITIKTVIEPRVCYKPPSWLQKQQKHVDEVLQSCCQGLCSRPCEQSQSFSSRATHICTAAHDVSHLSMRSKINHA
jgi:hypothetical protein